MVDDTPSLAVDAEAEDSPEEVGTETDPDEFGGGTMTVIEGEGPESGPVIVVADGEIVTVVGGMPDCEGGFAVVAVVVVGGGGITTIG